MGMVKLLTVKDHKARKTNQGLHGFIPNFSWLDNAGDRMHSKGKRNNSIHALHTTIRFLCAKGNRYNFFHLNLPCYSCNRIATVLRSSFSGGLVPFSIDD